MAFWAILGGMVKRALANKIGATVGSKALGAAVGKKISAGAAPTSIVGQIGQGLMNKAIGVGGGGGGMPGGDIPLPDDTNSQRVLTSPAQQQKKYYGIQR